MMALTPGQQQALNDFRMRMNARIAEVNERYSRGVTWEQISTEASAQWDIVVQADQKAKELSALSADDKKDLSYNSIDLLELKFKARALAARGSTPSMTELQDAAGKITFIYSWMRVLEPLLVMYGGRINFFSDLIEKASNAPGDVVRWTFDQLFRAMGLPSWSVPVVGVTAIVGLGAWAYFSFLAPVGTAARTARRISHA